MLRRALSSFSKQISNDSQTFPEPREYVVEDLAGCEPFKVYLGKPRIEKKGWYCWQVAHAEYGEVTIIAFSANQRKQYHDGRGFIARFPKPESKAVPQAFLNPVGD